MTIALENAAMTSIIGLCRDYSCVIYDADARQVAMVDAIPIDTNSMHLMLGHIVSDFADDIADGDVFLCNYPYSGGTHIGDLVTVCPVYFEGEHVSGLRPRDTNWTWAHPYPPVRIRLPKTIGRRAYKFLQLKIYEAGRERRDVLNLYLTNLRWRQALRGDLMRSSGQSGQHSAAFASCVLNSA